MTPTPAPAERIELRDGWYIKTNRHGRYWFCRDYDGSEPEIFHIDAGHCEVEMQDMIAALAQPRPVVPEELLDRLEYAKGGLRVALDNMPHSSARGIVKGALDLAEKGAKACAVERGEASPEPPAESAPAQAVAGTEALRRAFKIGAHAAGRYCGRILFLPELERLWREERASLAATPGRTEGGTP